MLLALSFAPAFAQQITGNIRGTVTDPTGALVQGATIAAIQADTGFKRTTTTNHQGDYLLLELPVGQYRVEVIAKGFREYVQGGILLNVNETASVAVRLAVGSEKEQVSVQADAELIESTVSTMGKVVGQRELEDLPLDGRNFSQLGLLQPGVAPITPGLVQAGGGLRDNQTYAVNGQRPESNNFLIDGAENFNGVDGGFVLKPPVDAIAEFRILTHNANAEFGGALGSTTNVITRSGTNSYHGAGWEFLRNDNLDAWNYFATQALPLKQNQFGATFGGPIRKDKTFFFGYYEGYRNREGVTQLTPVPSNAERQGNFAAMCDAGFTNGFCNNQQEQLGAVNPANGAFTPYPNNQLPSINPLSQSLLQYFPIADVGTNKYAASGVVDNDTNQFGIKIDHSLTQRDTLNFRYSFNQLWDLNPLSPQGASVPGFPVGDNQRAQNFVAEETHTFSPTLVGVLRFSFIRNKFLYGQSEVSTPPSSWGFQYSSSLPLAQGPPFIQISGYTDIGNPITGPRNTYENLFDYSGSLSWVRGKHEFKFGGGYQRQQINVTQGIATNGFFVFAPFPVTNAFASFLSGTPVVFLQGLGNFTRYIRGNDLNFYAQDTYKVSSRVTLNLGLRYDLPMPDTELHNLMSLWIPGRQSKVMPNAPTGLLYPGDPGVPAGLIPMDKTAFSPHVGIAWDLFGDGNTLLTSAYGVYYEPYYTGQGGPLQTPISAPPYLATPQVSVPNFSDPFNGNPPINGSFSTPLTNLTLAPNLTLPYTQDWDLNLQRSLGRDFLFEIGYVGTKGTHLPRFIEANPAVFVPGYVTDQNGQQQPISNSSNADQRRLYSGCTLADPPSNCIFSSTGEIASIADSSYNALETSLQKRFSHGVSFLASYTWSKAIDDASSFNMTGSAAKPVAGENDLAQNPFDLAAERGLSMFDARHRFVFSYTWALPFWAVGREWYKHAFGGWQLNGIVTVMSGTPFTVFDSNDVAAQGSAPEITGFSAQRPDLVGNPNSGPHTVTDWLNANAFQQLNPVADAGQFGTAGRNIAIGPSYKNWDFSAMKNFHLTESKALQFRAELFNFLNHPNFRLPDSDISSPTFNQILSARDPRQVQFALKFTY